MLQALAAKYAMQIIGALLCVLLIFGTIAYLKHQGAEEQKEKDLKELQKRNAEEKEESDKIWNDALDRLAQSKQTNQQNYEGALTYYADLNKKLSDLRSLDAERMRKLARIPAQEGRGNTKGGKAELSGTCPKPAGGTGAEVQTPLNLEVAEMAELTLLAAQHIRRTSNVR